MINRRQFLGLTGGAAITGTAAWAGLLREHSSSASHAGTSPSTSSAAAGASGASGAGDRILVVVQLSGGNDALNTLVPVGDGRYHDLRPTLALADDAVVGLPGRGDLALHKSLTPLVPLIDAGHLALVPGVGFSADSRSHFESLASWWTASPEHALTTGWIGRWLDATGVADDNPLAAVSLGSGAVPALRAERAVATAVNDLAGFKLRSRGTSAADAFLATSSPASTDALLASAQEAVSTAGRALDVLSKATTANAVAGDDTSAGTGPITAGLQAAAEVIDLGVGTRVLLVGGAGFDTHAQQAATHADLLADLAGGIAGFFTTLEQKGHLDKVLLLTTSEFGRRVAQNGSGGSDHGLGGVQLLVGSRVSAGVHGTVDLGDLVDGDLRAATDARSLYANALDWLGGPTDDVLGAPYDRLDLVTT
ncbi:MAG: hypothetical protein QOG39_1143 [Acidimicrobiaceae bacterium]